MKRVQHSRSPLELRKGLVMVRYNQVQAEAAGTGCFGGGIDPAINGDDKSRAGGGNLLQRLPVQPVAFSKTAGQVKIDGRGAELPQRLHHERSCGDPVGIVVPVHDNFLALIQGGPDPLYRFLHPFHQPG